MTFILSHGAFSQSKLDGYYYAKFGYYKCDSIHPTPYGDEYNKYFANQFRQGVSTATRETLRYVPDTTRINSYTWDKQTTYGLIDSNGKILIPFRYGWMTKDYHFKEYSIYHFARDDSIGMVTFQGEELFILPKFATADYCNAVLDSGQQGKIYQKIRAGIERNYGTGYGQKPMTELDNGIRDECLSQRSGYQLAGDRYYQLKINNRFGIYDMRRKKIIVPVHFDEVLSITPQLMRARINHTEYLVELDSGKEHTVPDHTYIASDDCYATVSKDHREIIKYRIKQDGHHEQAEQGEIQYISAVTRKDSYGQFIVRDETTGQYGVEYLDRLAIPSEYDDVWAIQYNWYWLKKDSFWAIASLQNGFNILTPFIYKHVDQMNDIYLQNVLYLANMDTTGILSTLDTTYPQKYHSRQKYEQIIARCILANDRTYQKYYYTLWPDPPGSLSIVALMEDGYHSLFLSETFNRVMLDSTAWDNIFIAPLIGSRGYYQRGNTFYVGYGQGWEKWKGFYYSPFSNDVFPVKRHHIYSMRYRGSRSGTFMGEHFSYHTGKKKYRRGGRIKRIFQPAERPDTAH